MRARLPSLLSPLSHAPALNARIRHALPLPGPDLALRPAIGAGWGGVDGRGGGRSVIGTDDRRRAEGGGGPGPGRRRGQAAGQEEREGAGHGGVCACARASCSARCPSTTCRADALSDGESETKTEAGVLQQAGLVRGPIPASIEPLADSNKRSHGEFSCLFSAPHPALLLSPSLWWREPRSGRAPPRLGERRRAGGGEGRLSQAAAGVLFAPAPAHPCPPRSSPAIHTVL